MPFAAVLAVRSNRLLRLRPFSPASLPAADACRGGLALLLRSCDCGAASGARCLLEPASVLCVRLLRASPGRWLKQRFCTGAATSPLRSTWPQHGRRSRPRRRLAGAQRRIRGSRRVVAAPPFIVAARVLDDAGTLGRGQARGQHANENCRRDRDRWLHLHPSLLFLHRWCRACWPAPPDPGRD